jgi:hypothetical protein
MSSPGFNYGCTVAVPATPPTTAAEHCQTLASAVASQCGGSLGFYVSSNRCATEHAFSVSNTCVGHDITLSLNGTSDGISANDLSYLGPLPDGETDTLVAGALTPPPIPALPTWGRVALLLALNGCVVFTFRRRLGARVSLAL